MDSTKIKQIKGNSNIPNESFISAAKSGNVTRVKQLLAEGYSPDQIDENSYTALMHAARNGHLEVVETLIKAEACLNKSDYLKKAQTALMLAINKRNCSIVTLLLEAGASVRITDNNENSVLMYAVRSGNFDLVKSLIEEWGVNIHHTNNAKQTALMIAADSGFINILKFLIVNHAYINKKDKFGNTALIYAASSGQISVVQYLIILKNLEIDLKDGKGNSALMTAVYCQHINILTVLIQANASINIQNSFGQTPLMIAARKGFGEMVNVLLKAGADKNLKDNVGQTAYDYAHKGQHTKIAFLLEQTQKPKTITWTWGVSTIKKTEKLEQKPDDLFIQRMKSSVRYG